MFSVSMDVMLYDNFYRLIYTKYSYNFQFLYYYAITIIILKPYECIQILANIHVWEFSAVVLEIKILVRDDEVYKMSITYKCSTYEYKVPVLYYHDGTSRNKVDISYEVFFSS